MRTRRQSPLVLLVCAALLIPFVGLRLLRWSRFPAHRPASQIEGGVMADSAASFAIISTAFPNGAQVPRRYTCDGADLSPAFAWHGAPDGTQSLALIADDPDAPGGTWTHWLLWNIPAKATLLPEDQPKVESLDNGARQGSNDFRRIGYGGPCPPPGKPHRYFFKLYALDARLDLKAGASRSDLELALKPHVLAQAQWIGTYGR
jgi:hypothetical protein